MLDSARQLIDAYRDRIVAVAASPFAHADYALARTMDYDGDPGLFGPGSVTWRIIGDVSGFVGGIRALLVQAAHPEVVAGVSDHSSYREDPLGRLSRTSQYVTATAFGAMPEVEWAVGAVRRAHEGVSGVSHRGIRYSAAKPEHAAWVHNALIDSFLAAYVAYGRDELTTAERDAYVAEQTQVGAMLDAEPLPATARGLADWVADHPALDRSPGMVETVQFLKNPPLDPPLKAGYLALFDAAAATLPSRLAEILEVRALPGARLRGRTAVGFLRWAMGSSPTWKLALIRSGAPIPDGLFRQRLPIGAREPV